MTQFICNFLKGPNYRFWGLWFSCRGYKDSFESDVSVLKLVCGNDWTIG